MSYAVQRFRYRDGWSRIDGVQMKAISDSFYKSRLCDMAVVLAEQFGHELPEGLKRWKEKNRKFDEKLEPTLAETANAKKTGISAEASACCSKIRRSGSPRR